MDSVKAARRRAAAPVPKFWAPAVLMLCLPATEALVALGRPNFVDRAYDVHVLTLWICAYGLWLLAAVLLAFPESARAVLDRLEGFGRMDPADRRAVLGLAWLGMSGLVFWLKFCQYRGFQLPQDTAINVNIAYNSLHGRWLEATPLGIPNYLGVHFAFLVPIFSPVLLFWRSALPLLLIQSVAVGSIGIAVYGLCSALTGSALAGFIGLLIAYAHPAFYELAGASLEGMVFAAPLYLWAMFFWERGRWGWSALFAALALPTREQVPFVLAGTGLYLALRSPRPPRWRAAAAAGALAAAALLWQLELKAIMSFPIRIFDYWTLYSQFGSGKDEVLRFVLGHPLAALARTVYPFSKLEPLAGLLWYCAWLPLAAPLAALPLWAGALPMVMMLPGLQHQMKLQYAALVFGPLLYASAHGLAVLWRRSAERRVRTWLTAAALAVAGWGLRDANTVLMKGWLPGWFAAAPPVLEKVPAKASVWCDEWVSSWLSARGQLKILHLDPVTFERLLFRPEYVVLHRDHFALEPALERNRVLVFLAENGYQAVDRREGLILLKDPSAPRPGGRSPELILPESYKDQRTVDEFIRRVFGPPRAG